MKIKLITVGKMKGGDLSSLYKLYHQRLGLGGDGWIIDLVEISDAKGEGVERKNKEGLAILKYIDNDKPIILCDEAGVNLSSRKFSLKLQDYREISGDIIIIIGGADGLSDAVKEKVKAGGDNIILSFGKMTWPHQLLRVMLMEQLYRAKMIMQNHPYHRD